MYLGYLQQRNCHGLKGPQRNVTLDLYHQSVLVSNLSPHKPYSPYSQYRLLHLSHFHWSISIELPTSPSVHSLYCILQNSNRLNWYSRFTIFTVVKIYKVAVLYLITQSHPTLCNPMDYSPPGFSLHGIPQAINTGVGWHALLQGIVPTQRSNPSLPRCWQILYCLSHQAANNEFTNLEQLLLEDI